MTTKKSKREASFLFAALCFASVCLGGLIPPCDEGEFHLPGQNCSKCVIGRYGLGQEK